MNSGFVEWFCAVVIFTTSRRAFLFLAYVSLIDKEKE